MMDSERVTTRQAAKELNIGLDTLQIMMQMGNLPIGTCIQQEGKKRRSYVIYRGLLNKYKNYINGMEADERYDYMFGQKVIENDD